MPLLPRTVGGRVLLATALALAIQTLASAAIVVAILAASAPGPSLPSPMAASAVVTAVVLGAIVAALVGLPLAGLTAGSIRDPLKRLAQRIRTGAVSETGWSAGSAPVEVSELAAAMRGLAAGAAARSAVAETERDRSATLLREMGDAVLVVRADDRIDLANPAADRLLGGPAAGYRLAEVARDHEVLQAVEAARSDGSSSAQIERVDPRRSIRVAAWRLPGNDVLVAAQDVTVVRKLETVRRDFVANVSHELRTPLASLKAMVETLEAGALDDPVAARDFLARIHRETDDLAQIVAELLSLARIESGGETLDRRPEDPSALVRAAVERMHPLADRAGVALSVAPAASLPPVEVDREKIATVLYNLIHNAVKFTPSGGAVILGVTRTDGHVAFAVRDTGTGIARADLDRVFERFYKGDPSRSEPGTGLGLAIAKHIVIAHGGEIHAESEGPGRGSTFRFTVPIRTRS